MSIIGDILGGTVGELVESIGGAADRFITTSEERNQFRLDAGKLIAARDSELEQTLRTEIEAKARIIEAEMRQGDSYTKRARPTVVYAGLVVLAVNHIILPWVAHFVGQQIPEINIPTEFWIGWSGIVGTWVVGRTIEKRAANNGTEPNKLAKLITG